MTEISMQDWLGQGREQKEAAAIIGCTPSNISQMLKAGRQLVFKLNKKGQVVSYYEIKTALRQTKPKKPKAA